MCTYKTLQLLIIVAVPIDPVLIELRSVTFTSRKWYTRQLCVHFSSLNGHLVPCMTKCHSVQVMIVLELLSNGDLRNYLLKHKPT